jgi:hypothetical protein
VYFVIFLILPAVATVLASARLLDQTATSHVLDLANPFRALHRVTPMGIMFGGPPRPAFPWPVHCLIFCGVTLTILGASVRRVRRAAVGDRSIRIEKKFRPSSGSTARDSEGEPGRRVSAAMGQYHCGRDRCFADWPIRQCVTLSLITICSTSRRACAWRSCVFDAVAGGSREKRRLGVRDNAAG